MRKICKKIVIMLTIVCMFCSSVEMNAFAKSLEIEAPENYEVAEIDNKTFNDYGASDYEYEVYEDGNAVITGYTGSATKLVIPSTLDGYPVEGIGYEAFWGEDLVSVTIPKGVTWIDSCAFADCTKLKSIKLPEGLELIGEGAFENCSSLKSIKIPKSVAVIDAMTFSCCSSLSNVELQEGLTTIGDYAFVGCKKLKRVTLPKSIESSSSISWWAFDWENITFYVYRGSHAEGWCRSWGYKYVVLSAIPSTKIKLSKSAITMYKGNTRTLKATLTPKNSVDKVKWSSSDKSIAKVSSKGVITGVKKGTATITALTSSGKTATCKVTVKEIKATKVKLNKTAVTLKKGKSATLKATLTPKKSTDTIKWSSSDKKVAKVSDKGKVTAVKKGTATITAKTSSGKKVTCKITVK